MSSFQDGGGGGKSGGGGKRAFWFGCRPTGVGVGSPRARGTVKILSERQEEKKTINGLYDNRTSFS